MIRYELKDKERQVALEKALPGFMHALQRDCGYQRDNGATYITVATCNWVVQILKEDIDGIGEYDPKKWNKYPEVTPPEGTLMRIEGHYQLHRDAHYAGAAIWGNGKWYPTAVASKDVVVERFRPWDEKWEYEE